MVGGNRRMKGNSCVRWCSSSSKGSSGGGSGSHNYFNCQMLAHCM